MKAAKISANGSNLGEIFVSHSSEDAAQASRVANGIRSAGHGIFFDSDRVDGIAPGAAWQRTLFRALRSCDAVVYLNSQVAQASMWCHSELVLAVELGKKVYSVDLGPDLASHSLLQSVQGIRFEADIDESIGRLTGCLERDGLAENANLRWERGRPPYPGLAAMEVADAGVFFGREDEIRRLTSRVADPVGQRDGDLVVVMGPSGAGKSSLVRAGLAARLALPRSGWLVASPFEPGIRPLDRLASRLAALAPGRVSEDECLDKLRTDGLAALGARLVDGHGDSMRRLLITLDQAEQMLAANLSSELREFLSTLTGGLGPGSPVTVVVTVRSDHFDGMQQLPAIGEIIRDPFTIAPVGRSQLAAVIEKPGARAGLTFEPGLVSRLVDDCARSGGESADALPLLAFALREMYDLLSSEDRSVFAAGDYERVGRIDGAISRRVESVETGLPKDSDPVLEELLPRFASLNEELLPTARPVSRNDLTDAERPVVDRLVDQRLLVSTADAVRLAHERLITAWPRLARAVAERRDDFLFRARLERQAADWKDGHGALLGRDTAKEARSWLARAGEFGTSSVDVSGFVRASGAAARRRRTGLIVALCIITALTVTASLTAVVAENQRSAAITQTHYVESNELAKLALDQMGTDTPQAMALSLEAYDQAPTIDALSALIEAAQKPLDGVLSAGGQVNAVSYSPDGRLIAVGGISGRIGLWDAATRKKTATLDAGIALNNVVFSPDGATLASAAQNGTTILWNVGTRQKIAVLHAHGTSVYSLAFSPDGRTLAASDNEGYIDLWNTTTYHRTASLTEDTYVESIAFSPDGRTLAAGGYDGSIDIWNTSDRNLITSVPEKHGSIYSVAFSPDGHVIAAGDEAGFVVLCDTTTHRITATLNNLRTVESIAFSPDGRTLAAGDFHGYIDIWNVAAKSMATTLGEGASVNTVAFSPDGHTLAAGDFNGAVGLWNPAAARATYIATSGTIYGMAFSPDGRVLATGDYAYDVDLWNPATGQRIATLDAGSYVWSLAFSPDSRILAVGVYGFQVILWNVGTRRKIARLREGSTVKSVAFSPDGRVLAAGTSSGKIGLWNMATDRIITTLNEGATVNSLAFSPDGRTLAVGDSAGKVELWNTVTHRRSAVFNEGSSTSSVAFSPDGLLATGGDGSYIGLWNPATRHLVSTLEGTGSIESVTFSRHGSVLTAGDYLGNVTIWSMANATAPREISRLYAGNNNVLSLAFAPDDRILAIAVGATAILLRQDLDKISAQYYKNLICADDRPYISRAQFESVAPGQPYQDPCAPAA